MKKFFNKDYTSHWLYPVIGHRCNNLHGLNFPTMYNLIKEILSFADCTISFVGFAVIPVSTDKFILVGHIVKHDVLEFFDSVELVTTMPLSLSTIRKYGKIVRDNFGWYRFKSSRYGFSDYIK